MLILGTHPLGEVLAVNGRRKPGDLVGSVVELWFIESADAFSAWKCKVGVVDS